jgi:gamma-glutamylcyclotransferase (GGCT)/AIG2-like uncharacterized protein YtfP
MSEDSPRKASTQKEEPSKRNDKETNKKFDLRETDLDSLDSTELGLVVAKGMKQVLSRLDQIEARQDNLEEHLEEKKVTVKSKEGKILERYEPRKKKRLIAKTFSQGNEGVRRSDVEEIFNVGEDQARKIMKKAGQEYDYLNWHYEGGPISSKLFHRVSKMAEDIADLSGIEDSDLDQIETKHGKILDQFDWSEDKESIQVLDEMKQTKKDLENKASQEKKRREAKKRFGSIF